MRQPDWSAIEAQADALFRRSEDLLRSAHEAKSSSRWRPYAIQLKSSNRKLAPQAEITARSGRIRNTPTGPFVTSTYVSIQSTCPSSCPFKGNGCYAEHGMKAMMKRLNHAARNMTPLAVTQAEAAALGTIWPRGVPQDGETGGRDLRLHVGGEVSCQDGARALGDAVASLKSRGLGDAWTYTHRWRSIDRSSWGPIRVLASCETEQDVSDALRRGYAPAMTIPVFPDRRAQRIGGARMIPCPAEASPRSPTCSQCRLCMDGELPSRQRGVLFAIHGLGSTTAKRRLKVLNAPQGERK